MYLSPSLSGQEYTHIYINETFFSCFHLSGERKSARGVFSVRKIQVELQHIALHSQLKLLGRDNRLVSLSHPFPAIPSKWLLGYCF